MSALRAATRFCAQRSLDFFSRQPSLERRTFQLESLEQRTMLAADLRAIDGSDNNILHPDWGSTLEQLLRTAPAEY